MRYDTTTRVLHLLLAVGITLQLLVSLVMVTPKPGRLPNIWFEIHETLGTSLLAVLCLHWLWSLTRSYGGDAGMLMPWFSRARLTALWKDVLSMAREIARMRIPMADRQRPLAGAVEGLGLLAATYLAASGAFWGWAIGPDGASTPLLHAIKESHEFMGSVMWVYLIGHVAMGLIHHLGGEATIPAMFSFRNGQGGRGTRLPCP